MTTVVQRTPSPLNELHPSTTQTKDNGDARPTR